MLFAPAMLGRSLYLQRAEGSLLSKLCTNRLRLISFGFQMGTFDFRAFFKRLYSGGEVAGQALGAGVDQGWRLSTARMSRAVKVVVIGLLGDPNALDLGCREVLNGALGNIEARESDLHHQLVGRHL